MGGTVSSELPDLLASIYRHLSSHLRMSLITFQKLLPLLSLFPRPSSLLECSQSNDIIQIPPQLGKKVYKVLLLNPSPQSFAQKLQRLFSMPWMHFFIQQTP